MHKFAKKSLVVLLASGLLGSISQAATYELDVSHSSIGFSVRHMLISNVKGNFKEFSGSVEYAGESAADIKASAEIVVASIDTDNQKRDDHLRNPDFFDAEKFPSISFKTTRVDGTLPNVTLVGDLTIRGVTKEVSIPVEFVGPITDPWGNERIGFSGDTTINRQDFGVSWSNTMDNGGLVVSDEVKLVIEAEAVKK